VLTVRPKLAELVFRVYGRSLHPELFVIHRSASVNREGYRARIDITSAGHVVTWTYKGLTLSEVAASARQPMPQRRRLLSHLLRGQRNDGFECQGRVRYQMCFELERFEPENFWAFQYELLEAGARRGLLHRADSGGRIALGALSYVDFEPLRRELSVHAFHTFPGDYAVVKSQSLFRLP
jgi:hypothetical protein